MWKPVGHLGNAVLILEIEPKYLFEYTNVLYNS